MPQNLGTYINDYDIPRKKDVDDAGGGSGLYNKIQKEQDYLYQVWYDELDYDGAYEYFRTHADPPFGACSSVRNGNFFGRNFDWYYDNNAEFKVNVSAAAGRYASQGMAGGFSDLTESFVSSGVASDTYKLVPFKMYDGQNECGLTANINVVPTDNGTNVSVPTDTSEVEICGMMVIRYLLDHFDTAYKAVSYMQQHMTIYFTDDLHEHNYELHFMVADKTSTYIVEFVDNHAVIIDATTRPYMTNFIIDGVTFNDDGTVYTPETQTAERDAMNYNGITANGSGLERYNLIVGNYSSANTKAGMMGLMSQLTYSRAYTTSTDPSDPYWYTEFVGDYNTFTLNCASQPSEFAAVIATAGQYYLDRDRDVSNTWQTTHSVVYDISKGEMTLIVQESQTQHTYMLERTTFTPEEWAAIQSGITETKVNTYDNHIANTDIHVTAADKTVWDEKYTLPADGIPDTDLSSDVQNSLALADTAIQDVSGLTARLFGSNAPTTSTVGAVGDLYTDTTTGKMYHCTAVASGVYTWEEVGSGAQQISTDNESITNDTRIKINTAGTIYRMPKFLIGTAISGKGQGITTQIVGSQVGDIYINEQTNNVYMARLSGTDLVWDYRYNTLGAVPYNVNLLDNADWYAYIVNQRGNTTYSGLLDAYGIDRWRTTGSITVYNPTSADVGYVALANGCVMKQRMEIMPAALSGKTVTAAVDIGGTVHSGTVTFPSNGEETVFSDGGVTVAVGIDSGTYELSGVSAAGVPYIKIAASSAVNVRRVWLELGDVCHMETTPPKSYATNLAICQRYYYQFTVSSAAPLGLGIVYTSSAPVTFGVFAAQLPVAMRTTPTLSTDTTSTANDFFFGLNAGVVITNYEGVIDMYNPSTPLVRVTFASTTMGRGLYAYAQAGRTFRFSADL